MLMEYKDGRLVVDIDHPALNNLPISTVGQMFGLVVMYLEGEDLPEPLDPSGGIAVVLARFALCDMGFLS